MGGLPRAQDCPAHATHTGCLTPLQAGPQDLTHCTHPLLSMPDLSPRLHANLSLPSLAPTLHQPSSPTTSLPSLAPSVAHTSLRAQSQSLQPYVPSLLTSNSTCSIQHTGCSHLPFAQALPSAFLPNFPSQTPSSQLPSVPEDSAQALSSKKSLWVTQAPSPQVPITIPMSQSLYLAQCMEITGLDATVLTSLWTTGKWPLSGLLQAQSSH